MENIDNRTPEEIENDIERTRADFSSTIDAIQRKLSPSEMMDNAVDYALSTTPGAFSMNLVNTVRENPIPVALIGIGIAWLMKADRQPRGVAQQRYTRSVRQPIHSSYANAEFETMDDAEYLAARDYGAGEYAADSEEGIMQKMASKTKESARELKESASHVGQKISGTASSVTGRVQQAGQSARSRLQESADMAQARISTMGERSQVQIGRAKEQFGQMLNEQPFVLSAVGLAVGAALGAAIPTTRRENEMMGSVRDDLLERAKDVARDQAEVLKQSAQRIVDTAKTEVERVAENAPNVSTQQASQGSAQPTTTGKSQFGEPSGSQSIH